MKETKLVDIMRVGLKRYGTILIYIGMVLAFSLIRPQYFSFDNFKSILVQASLLGIIASGMTLVMMTGGADLSVAAVAGLSVLAGLWPVVFGNTPLLVGLLISVAIALFIGAINGVCVSKLGVAPFVATLGTMFFAQGMQYVFSEGGLSISYGFPDAFKFIGTGNLLGIPMPILIYLVIFLVLHIATEHAPFGRYLKATGLNQFTSELSGIPIRFYTFISYVLCSLLAAVLGLTLCAFQTFAAPDLGSSFLMDSLLVVLLGKTLINNKIAIYGTAFGAIFLRSFETGLAMIGTPVTVLNICKGTLLVGVLLLTLIKQKRTQKK
mgnify:FL=1